MTITAPPPAAEPADPLRAVAMVVRQALPSRVVLLIAVALLVSPALVSGLRWLVRDEGLDEPGMLVGVFWLGALMTLWSGAIHRLLLQNDPVIARMVPGQAAALRQAVLWLWVLALVLCVPGLLLFGTSLISGLALAAMALVVLARAMHWPQLFAIIGPAFGLVSLLRGWEGAAHWWRGLIDGPWRLAVVAGIAMLGALALLRLLHDGGARHRRLFDALQRRRDPGMGWGSWGHGGACLSPRRDSLLVRWHYAPHDRWLSRLSAGAPASMAARAMVALGPQLNPRTAAMSAVWTLAVVSLLAGVIGLFASYRFASVLEGIAVGMGYGGGWAWMGLLMGMRMNLWHSRGEQALVSLAPGVQRGKALNRVLLRHMTLFVALQFLGFWLAPLLLLLVTGSLHGEDFLQALAALAITLPAFLPGLWQDWSRLKGPAGGPFIAAHIVASFIAMALAVVATARGGAWMTGALALVWGVAALRLSWKALRHRHWLAALPAGRNG